MFSNNFKQIFCFFVLNNSLFSFFILEFIFPNQQLTQTLKKKKQKFEIQIDFVLIFCIKLCKLFKDMSSPLYKHTNDNSAMKQRKAKSANTAKSTTNLDSRTELADLVKRKAEIAVCRLTHSN